MTAQEKIKTLLEGCGLPFREVKVYGSQVTVECWCRDAATKWAVVVGKFARVKGVMESTVYTKESEGRGGMIRDTFKVWRVYGTI